MPKIVRVTTVPVSLNVLLRGQLKFISENGFIVLTASANGPEVRELTQREGVEHFEIPFTRVISPFKDFLCLCKMIVLLRKVKPDIVHTHTPKAGLIGMMAAKMVGIKYRLHTIAGMPLMEAKGLSKVILQATEKITLACASSIYPNSNNLKQWIIDNLKPNLSKLKVIGNGSSNGIDTGYFKKNNDIIKKSCIVRDELGIRKNETLYIFVGRLVRDKGVTELVNAFKKINDENSHLLLLGDFEDQREGLSEKIKDEITNNKNIHAPGFVRDIRPYMAASDIFVFPSYREGFPNVVLQACCMDLPCIVTDINGSNEIITNNVNGLIIPPKNMHKLEEAMRLLKNERVTRMNLAQASRESVLKYDQQKLWAHLLLEYKTMIP